MASLITPVAGDDVTAEVVAQITEALSGLRNIPLSVTGVNDGASYALSLRNAGTGGRGLQVLNSSGATLLLVQDSGVSIPGSGTTLTAPHFTSPVVDAGGLVVTAGTTVLNSYLTVTNGVANPGGAGAIRLPNAQGVSWRNGGNTNDDDIQWSAGDEFQLRPNQTAAWGFTSTYMRRVGTTAGAGVIRLINGDGIDWRNAGNTSDHSVSFNGSDEFVIAPNLTATFVMDTTGRIRLSSGSPNAAYKLHILGLGASSATWGFRSENNVGGLIFGVRDDGLVSFGTVVGTAGASAGYITILDAGGTQRKIQVFAP